MTSMQAPAGSSKAAKFQAANPLAPMADPFAGLDDDQKEYQKALAENVNKRMTKAMADLKEKHAKGIQERDDPDRAPTGEPYKQAQAREAMQRLDAKRLKEEMERQEEVNQMLELKVKQERELRQEEDSDVDSDDSLLDDLDNDPELDAIRQRRLEEMKQKQIQFAENKARGHGQYRSITQDEFLPECTSSSKFAVIHFFHKDFERCKIMDHHLGLIAPQHMECKFLRIDAEKAPFFVEKLKIKTLPSVLVFEDGKAIDRLVGFQDLATDGKPDEWETGRLQMWLCQTGAIEYTPPPVELQEEMQRLGLKPRGAIYGREINYDEG